MSSTSRLTAALVLFITATATAVAVLLLTTHADHAPARTPFASAASSASPSDLTWG